jgi:citrate lyase beta subunit
MQRCFRPDEQRNRTGIGAFQGGAERFGDEMIERMHIEAAHRVLDRAKS